MNENVNVQVKTKSSVSVKEALYATVKRTIDILGSFVGLLLLVPIILIIKVISLTHGDFHSIFFTQNRIGKNGKEFKFFKFRSMVPNADVVLEELLKNDPEAAKEYKLNKKLTNDPRITSVGKIIRKYSIDELPQLINVFLGNMTLIGNRPYLPREKEDMGEYYNDIVSTKPGITGYWQVSGRSDVSFQKRLELEQYYSNNYSFKLDMKIALKTFGAVFGHKGAK